ncbi:hypothetical protein [Streptomyces hokutonensis]
MAERTVARPQGFRRERGSDDDHEAFPELAGHLTTHRQLDS